MAREVLIVSSLACKWKKTTRRKLFEWLCRNCNCL